MDNTFDISQYNGILIFSKMFCAVLLFQFIISFNEQLTYFNSNPRRIYGNPIKLFALLRLPKLSKWMFLCCGVAFAISLFLLMLGFYPRLFAATAILTYFLYFNQIVSLAYVQRKTNLIPIILLILCFAPSLTKGLNSTVSEFEFLPIKLVLAQVYFSAGLQKLLNCGLSWCNGETLRAYLLENYLWSDSWLAYQISTKKALLILLSTTVLVFELTFLIAIFFPKIVLFYAVFALLFHFGTLVTMRINYLKYIMPAYMVFFTQFGFSIYKILEPTWKVYQ